MADGHTQSLEYADDGVPPVDGEPAIGPGVEVDRDGIAGAAGPARTSEKPAGDHRAIDRTDLILSLAIFIVAAVFQFTRLSSVVDHKLIERWFELFPGSLSGDLVVVEIDSRSIRELRTWPWPRTYHAEVIRRLADAGAVAIGVDIDFSSYSTLENDLALISAVAGAPIPVVFPVFRQWGWVAPDEPGLIQSQPFPELAANALLAHVNVQPDDDGIVRHHIPWTEMPGIGTLPSMPMALAATGSHPSPFVLDFSIPISDVARVSFVDLMRGNFDAADIAGRRVLIGATALELGDQLSVPVYVTLPGVFAHALAFETLHQDRALTEAPAPAVLAISLALSCLLVMVLRRLSWRSALIAAVAATAFVLSAGALAQTVLAVIVPVMPWLLVIVLAFVAAALLQIDVLMEQLLRKAMTLIHRTSMMNSVVNDTSDGILIADREGNVTFANPALKAMLGLNEADLARRQLARRFADLTGLWHDDGGTGNPDDMGVRSGSAQPAECEVETADGSHIIVAIRAAYSRMGRNGRRDDDDADLQHAGIFTLRDVTAQKALEEAQRRALQEATQASQTKTNFLANMNHELRTPLNAIIGFSEIMRTQAFGPLGSEAYVEYAESIHESGDRLLATVNDVMEAARIDSGAYKLTDDTVDVGALLRESVASLREAAADRKVAVAIDDPEPGLTMTCDIDAVQKIVGKIADNAVKFSRHGGRVHIRTSHVPEGGLAIAVADQGIGLSQEDITRILQPFGQADAALNRKFEGSGLGLTIAGGLIRLHGGSLEIASTLGVGTTVTLTFPPERVTVREAAYPPLR